MNKRLLSFLLVFLLMLTFSSSYVHAAANWPAGPDINAESAILIDADSGAVLYEKNADTQHYPASITKIMTGLLAIENCKLDETVTFSRNSIFSLEPGSTHMGCKPGEQLSVKDCLYGLMLKSANETANALAEHISGSVESFADLMNQKAAELGCTNTHFVTANGLHDDQHYTTARDMALIAKAAYSNETFVKIDSTPSYRIPPTNLNDQSFMIYMGHKMVNKNRPEYYPGIIGGKTGYTTISGNTLVTCAQRDGMKLICVILKGQKDYYYGDTKAILDFGYSNFKKVNISENDKTYTVADSGLSIAGLTEITDKSPIGLNKRGSITLPITADFADTTSSLTYELPATHDANAIASITYQYGDRTIGTTTLEFIPQEVNTSSIQAVEKQNKKSLREMPVSEISSESDPATDAAAEPSIPEPTGLAKPVLPVKESSINFWGVIGIIIAIAIIAVGIIVIIRFQNEQERKQRHVKRADRLSDLPLSSALQFDNMLKQRMLKGKKKNPRK